MKCEMCGSTDWDYPLDSNHPVAHAQCNKCGFLYCPAGGMMRNFNKEYDEIEVDYTNPEKHTREMRERIKELGDTILGLEADVDLRDMRIRELEGAMDELSRVHDENVKDLEERSIEEGNKYITWIAEKDERVKELEQKLSCKEDLIIGYNTQNKVFELLIGEVMESEELLVHAKCMRSV